MCVCVLMCKKRAPDHLLSTTHPLRSFKTALLAYSSLPTIADCVVYLISQIAAWRTLVWCGRHMQRLTVKWITSDLIRNVYEPTTCIIHASLLFFPSAHPWFHQVRMPQRILLKRNMDNISRPRKWHLCIQINNHCNLSFLLLRLIHAVLVFFSQKIL